MIVDVSEEIKRRGLVGDERRQALREGIEDVLDHLRHEIDSSRDLQVMDE